MDWLVFFGFMMMVLSPCVVALATGVTDGADLGVRDLAEPRFEAFAAPYLPEPLFCGFHNGRSELGQQVFEGTLAHGDGSGTASEDEVDIRDADEAKNLAQVG